MTRRRDGSRHQRSRAVHPEDDTHQAEQARRLIEAGLCYIPDTVLLELAWVLKKPSGNNQRRIARQIRVLLGIQTLRVSNPLAVRQALDDAEAGMDLADAFHRAFAGPVDRMCTFDVQFANAATDRPGIVVESL